MPHVTHNDESDITEIDAYRKELDGAAKDKGYRVTLLAFLMKAAVSALREFPEFNSSLSPEKDSLIVKKYYHIGIAADTPEGLVVPVIRDVDRKGIHELSRELGSASKRAREGKLSSGDMQGAGFTISSLGGIGRPGFAPIVSAPEVALLGVCGSRWRRCGTAGFRARLMLPVSLSYDHRVINGAWRPASPGTSAACLEDVRRLVLCRRASQDTLESCPMSMTEIRIPDIGDFKDVPIIEVHVEPGAKVSVEDPLLTLESDKATLEVPCPRPARSARSRSRPATAFRRAT